MFARILITAAVAGAMFGCGGGGSDIDLNKVSGTVTMDGNPLEDARVIFTPRGGGRPAFGMTDSNGRYQLAFSSTGMGAVAGEYVVKISTYRAAEEDPDTGQMTPEVPERVPDVYVANSSLSATVPGGSYDFGLKSDAGDIVQRTFDTGEE